MNRSHNCIGCGSDLSTVRGRYDARFRFPVVRCPKCGATVVRRVDAYRRSHRTRWRLLVGSTLGSGRLLVAFLLMLLFIAGGAAVDGLELDQPLQMFERQWSQVVFVVVGGTLIGSVVYGLFYYIRLRWLASGWVLAACVLMCLSWVSNAMIIAFNAYDPRTLAESLPPWQDAVSQVSAMVLFAMVCGLGIPLGGLVRRSVRDRQLKRLRRLRNASRR